MLSLVKRNALLIIILVFSLGFVGVVSMMNSNNNNIYAGIGFGWYIGWKYPVNPDLTIYVDSAQVTILDGETEVNWTHALNTINLAVVATPMQNITANENQTNSWWCVVYNATTIGIDVAYGPSEANWTFSVIATIIGYA